MQFEESSVISRPQVSNSSVVTDLDIFVLIIIVLISLFRALVYVANNRSEVFQGYILRSTMQFRTRSPSGTTLLFTEKRSLEPITYGHKSAVALKHPWHFPMHFSFRHSATSLMQYRVLENYTVVQVLLMAGYTAAVFFAVFYGSNPFTNTRHLGWVIGSQIPFVYAFTTKNNVVGLLVGVGYEKLNYLHRHVGRLIVIVANVHALGYLYKWNLAGDISQMISKPFVYLGIIALVCVNLLGFFSIQCVRTKSYNLFVGTHVMGSIVLLVAACNHRQACVPYAIAGSVVYGLDHIIRGIKTHLTTATLRTIPELGLTQVDIPSLNCATDTEEGLVLMCKRTGNWTRKLYKMAQTTAASGEQDQKPDRRVKVMVEGPYGGVGDTAIPSYSAAMFVVGGSGVTFALSAVQDLVLAGDRSRTEVIEVIWSITNPAALENFIPRFAALVSQSPARLRISVFYTRIPTTQSFIGLLLPPGVTLTPGRPKIGELLDGLVTSMTTTKNGTHGVFVTACGPTSLARDVSLAVRTLDVNSKIAIGGIQFHEECVFF
ncbi:ferric reductase like transmembrane component-domain-containing protein [Lanmaoa asiatica]|nr:ferric reductase like transmembrane component-domain-containing protein [Lanmaoa asiatica]